MVSGNRSHGNNNSSKSGYIITVIGFQNVSKNRLLTGSSPDGHYQNLPESTFHLL